MAKKPAKNADNKAHRKRVQAVRDQLLGRKKKPKKK